MNRVVRRRESRAVQSKTDAPRVYIIPPDEFLDSMGDGWRLQRGEDILDLDFLGVLAWTVRRMPVKTGEDSERSLEILTAITSADPHVELRRGDYEWLKTQLKEHAHNIWMAPDAALLRKTVEACCKLSPPEA